MKLLDILKGKLFKNVNYPKEIGRPDTKTYGGKDIFARFMGDIIANKDYILKLKAQGKGYDFYLEMEEKDPKLYGLIRTRKKAVAGLAWDVLPYVSDPGKNPRGGT